MKFIRILKGGLSQQEKDQIGALDNSQAGNYNIYQNGWGEIFLTKHKLNDEYMLMDTANTFADAQQLIEEDWYDHANSLNYDKELINEPDAWFLQDQYPDEEPSDDWENTKMVIDLSKDYAD